MGIEDSPFGRDDAEDPMLDEFDAALEEDAEANPDESDEVALAEEFDAMLEEEAETGEAKPEAGEEDAAEEAPDEPKDVVDSFVDQFNKKPKEEVSEEDKSKENEESTKANIKKIDKARQEEAEVTQDVPEGEEKTEKQKEFEQWASGRGIDITKPGRKKIAAKEWTIDKEKDSLTRSAVEKVKDPSRQEIVEEAIARFGGAEEFYERYKEAQDSPFPKEKSIILYDKLRQTLNKKADPPFTDAEVQDIFNELTSSEQLQKLEFINIQERLVLAMEIDAELGTDIARTIEEEIMTDKSLSGEEKMRKVDKLLVGVTELFLAKKLEGIDKELEGKLRELKELNEESKELKVIIKDTKAAEDLGKGLLDIQKTSIKATVTNLEGKIADYPNMPGLNMAFFAAQVDAGNGDYVEGILENPDKLEKTANGYKGEMNGEIVHLEERDGRMVAMFKVEGKEIIIPRTDPPAVGYDIARSEKITTEMGWSDITKNTVLRRLLLDNPLDGEFMTNEEAENFKHLVIQILGTRQSVDADHRLQELHLIDKQGRVDYRYVTAVKTYIERKGSDVKDIKLDKDELSNLTNEWYAQGGPNKNDDMPLIV